MGLYILREWYPWANSNHSTYNNLDKQLACSKSRGPLLLNRWWLFNRSAHNLQTYITTTICLFGSIIYIHSSPLELICTEIFQTSFLASPSCRCCIFILLHWNLKQCDSKHFIITFPLLFHFQKIFSTLLSSSLDPSLHCLFFNILI